MLGLTVKYLPNDICQIAYQEKYTITDKQVVSKLLEFK